MISRKILGVRVDFGLNMEKALDIIENSGFKGIKAGHVQEGEKQVIIKPLNITYKSESLNIR